MKEQGNYIFVDYAVSKDCINIDSYGMICVHCGCCKRNPSYRDMIRQRIKYYKSRLAEQYKFSDWDEDEYWRNVQKKNINSNIIYHKRNIRICKKIMRTMKGNGT